MPGDFLRALPAESAAVLLAPSFAPAATIPPAPLSAVSKFWDVGKLTFQIPQTNSLAPDYNKLFRHRNPDRGSGRYLSKPRSQAQALTADLMEVRWLLVEQDVLGIPVPVLVAVLFWLCLLFMSFGLFAPRNATATVVLFLCALAVAAAIQTILDLSRPFQGSFESLAGR
jgi:hypothetical protein